MVVCLNCGKRPEFRCAGCGVARFCCQACQRACWKGHRPHCGSAPDLTAKDLVENVPEAFASAWPEEEQLSDALLLAQLLKALGVCKDGRILGQQPLLETELWEHITKSRRGLAALLFGRN
ncbi:Deaf1, partial [Symbiodinium necroappetens]